MESGGGKTQKEGVGGREWRVWMSKGVLSRVGGGERDREATRDVEHNNGGMI